MKALVSTIGTAALRLSSGIFARQRRCGLGSGRDGAAGPLLARQVLTAAAGQLHHRKQLASCDLAMFGVAASGMLFWPLQVLS